MASEVAFSFPQEKQTNCVDLSCVFLNQSGRTFGVVFDRTKYIKVPGKVTARVDAARLPPRHRFLGIVAPVWGPKFNAKHANTEM